MDTASIKTEPNFEDVKIKIEPDDPDSSYGCLIIKDEFDIKIEIKEEDLEDDDSHAKDDSMSPHSSQPFSPDSTCRVEILEQPVKKVRFRYLSELQGTPHGPLLGERSSKTNKTFPKVRLVGYEGRKPVKMRCWLVDKAEIPRGEVRPHCHDLVVRKCMPRNEIAAEPHEISISRENDFTAMFENMVVLHCVQKDSESKYLNKHLRWNDRDQPDSKFDKKKIRDIIKSINKNEVYLYFEAYIEYPNSVEVLCHALSNPIKNLKNPVSGDLKICKVLNNFGSCEGNTEVGLFTEKVPPDVKIKFFRADNMWEHIVSPEFMHRNVALTFRTPKFPFDIEKDIKAQFCLYRESDGVTSNIMDFSYQPSDIVHGTRKRRHGDVSSTVESPPMNYANSDTTDDDVSNDLSFFGKVKLHKPSSNIVNSKAISSGIALSKSKTMPNTTEQPLNSTKLALNCLNQPLTNVKLESNAIKESVNLAKRPLICVNQSLGFVKREVTLEDTNQSKPLQEANRLSKVKNSLVSLSPNQVHTIKTLKPGIGCVLSSQSKLPQQPKKVFHVSKLKFQTFLKMMKSKGYTVKSIP